MASPQPPKASANGMPYVEGGKNTEHNCKEYLWAITAKLQDRDLVGELRQRRCASESLKKLSLHLIETPAGPADSLPKSGPAWHSVLL